MNDALRPAPGIMTGPRVVVRPYTDADAPALWEATDESRDHLQPWLPWVKSSTEPVESLSYVRACQAHFLLREDFPLGVFLRDGRFLGGTGLHLRDKEVPEFEIGYWVRSDAEGQGYVTEAVRLVTTCAFEQLGAQRLLIRCDAANERSRRVAERCGYVYEGRLRNNKRNTAGNLFDMLYFSMMPEEYDRMRQTVESPAALR